MSQLLPIWCPACDRQQVSSQMRKTVHQSNQGMMTACVVANHSYSYDRLMALKPRMMKVNFQEKQPGNTLLQQFWIYPEALQALRERWPSNMMTTVCSFLTSLADGSSFIVEGEYAAELAKANPPITRGRDVAGMLETIKQLNARIATLEQQIQRARATQQVAQTPAPNNAQLEAIMAALSGAGINVPIIAQPVATTILPQRDPDDVDYREGDPDLDEIPIVTEAPMAVKIPISNYRSGQ